MRRQIFPGSSRCRRYLSWRGALNEFTTEPCVRSTQSLGTRMRLSSNSIRDIADCSPVSAASLGSDGEKFLAAADSDWGGLVYWEGWYILLSQNSNTAPECWGVALQNIDENIGSVWAFPCLSPFDSRDMDVHFNRYESCHRLRGECIEFSVPVLQKTLVQFMHLSDARAGSHAVPRCSNQSWKECLRFSTSWLVSRLDEVETSGNYYSNDSSFYRTD